MNQSSWLLFRNKIILVKMPYGDLRWLSNEMKNWAGLLTSLQSFIHKLDTTVAILDITNFSGEKYIEVEQQGWQSNFCLDPIDIQFNRIEWRHDLRLSSMQPTN